MKLRIEVSPETEDEIIIRCKSVSEDVIRLQRAVDSVLGSGSELALSIGATEYYVAADDILFFETQDGRVAAHTADRMFFTELKLFELEQQLPRFFARASKSCIVNVMKVESVDRSLTGASTVTFVSCRKKAYISRMYFGQFRDTLNEMRFSK